ncbi:E3 ubiquitin-protein ligase RNF4 [Diachasma alloeum]|uniref:E3 ubiquitin-protein ligase RNF4 n=1 Tax=Diachasma alloeum TaxID=454923 RepID=UPI0007384597|nr:E3 ubiquitin-protein ligase RNF4 [Diachasma alloeum]XP_028982376.1 E3 ubiquitin-protein ligase RNF4 [Diachasma alloeum]XP_028982377.1 E3 ubiquitin-protein ligase RNF4 [Diachasma alloeum]
MSTVPKRRRRNRTESMSPQPVHYIDLTADSPMQPTRQTRGRGNQVAEQNCDEATDRNSHVSRVGVSIRLLDTIVIDSADPSPARGTSASRRIGRPKRRSPATTSTAAGPEEGSVIDLDSTIPDDDHNKLIPQINDSVDGSPTVLTCPVCFEDLRASRKPMSTKCGHIFCEDCLLATLVTQKKCPKCKGSITRKTCHRIYF